MHPSFSSKNIRNGQDHISPHVTCYGEKMNTLSRRPINDKDDTDDGEEENKCSSLPVLRHFHQLMTVSKP
jgi:hypothetical protein